MMTRSGSKLRVLARKDAGVRALADLRGRRIGVAVGTNSHYFLDTLLRYAKVPLGEVNIVAVDPATRPMRCHAATWTPW